MNAVARHYHSQRKQQVGTILCRTNLLETMRPEECSVRSALSVIGGKWKPVITHYLLRGTKRFGELRKLMPDVTQKMLTQQLREMESDGVVARKIYHEIPPKVEYSLTKYGHTLRPVMVELCKWGERHLTITKRKNYRQSPARLGRTVSGV
jgi:DNA-binding HxlR family transcriptional regulator